MPTRVTTPIVQQMERTECGAASLGIMLGYYGRWVSLEQLRVDCGISRDGSRASNILQAARRHGLQADGFKVELDNIKSFALPFIVFWSFNHFLVVEGFDKSQVHLNDPAIGRRSVSWEEFDRNFTGVVLELRKTAAFQPGGAQPSVLAGLIERLRASTDAIAFIGLISLVMVVPGILIPSFSRLFVDYFLVKRFEDWLYPILGGMAATAVIQALLVWMQQHYLMRFETKMAIESSSAFIRHMLRLPIGYFGQRQPSELAARSTSTDSLAALVSTNLGTAAMSLPSIVIFSLVMLSYDITLTLLAFGFAALNFLALRALARQLSERNQAAMIARSKLAGTGMQGLQMIDDYRSMGFEAILFQRLVGLHARANNLGQPLSRARLFLQAMPVTLNATAMAALFTLGGYRVMTGGISAGILVAFMALLQSFMAPINKLISLGDQIQNAQGYIAQIDDLMRQPEAPEFGSSTSPSNSEISHRRLIGRIDIDGLVFGHSPLEPPLIENFSLSIAPGEWIAISGASGCGKSTLARLLCRIVEPWAGEIHIDGKPIADIPHHKMRSSVAVVDQTVTLFAGTIRENIAMWDPTMTEERIVAAAKIATIHDFIVSRPGGYDSRLSENGSNLSGGQRALIELARAVANSPSIIVLDEVTAALDAVTERQVLANLRQLGATCIVIAHRLASVRNADRIIMMEYGRAVQTGNHEQLAAANGPYLRMVQTQ